MTELRATFFNIPAQFPPKERHNSTITAKLAVEFRVRCAAASRKGFPVGLLYLMHTTIIQLFSRARDCHVIS